MGDCTTGRRGFIRGVGGVFAASALGTLAETPKQTDVGNSVSRVKLPDWALRAIDETKARIDEWRRRGDGHALLVSITDVHSGIPDVSNPIDWADPKSHVLIAQEAVRRLGADAMLDLGDADYQQLIGWRGPKPSKAEADELIRGRIKAQFKLYRDFERPVYFCRGNHDRGRTNKEFTAPEFGEFNLLAAAHGHSATLGGERTYGYFDLPAQKVRVFFLDTCELGYYGFTPAQVEFVATGLGQLPDDWTAVAAGHYCIVNSFGRWVDVDKPLNSVQPEGNLRGAVNGDAMHGLFAGFVHSEAGGKGGVKWDFTGRRQRRFAGCLCGDSHFDNLSALDDVCYVVTQGYGGMHPKAVPPGAFVTRGWDRRKTPLIDVLGVRRVDGLGEGSVFRIGAGGAARDRAWRF